MEEGSDGGLEGGVDREEMRYSIGVKVRAGSVRGKGEREKVE